MSGILINTMLLVHIAVWITQIMINQAGGNSECNDVSSFICGAPLLQSLAEVPARFNNINNPVDVIFFLISLLKALLNTFVGLAFFNYGWLNDGGTITNMAILLVRMILGGVLFGVLGRVAVSIVGGRL